MGFLENSSSDHWIMIIKTIFFVVVLILIVLSMRSSVNLKIRSLHRRLIAFEFMMIGFLIYEIYLLNSFGDREYSIRFEQTNMIKAAQKFKQTSNDLTQFSRYYFATGDKIYLQQYHQVKEIFDGKTPRPYRYDQVYWELEPKIREERHPFQSAKSLDAVLASLPYTDLEKQMLDLAHEKRKKLDALEEKAFVLWNKNQRKESVELLYSQFYKQALHETMLPIDRLLTMLDDRSTKEIIAIQHKIYLQFVSISIILLLFILGNGWIYFLLRRKVDDPIDYLTDVIRHYQSSESISPKTQFYNDEIGEMQRDFFQLHKQLKEKSHFIEGQRIFLQTLLDSIPNPIFYKNSQGEFLGFNNAYVSIFGITDKDILIGKTVKELDFLPERDREIYFQEDQEIIVSGKSLSRQQIIPFADGLEHTTVYSVIGIRDEYDQPNGLIGTFVDITEIENTKKELEELYRKTRESIEYAALIQSAIRPDEDSLKKCFSDYMVLFEPKDTVGGDIYLLDSLRHPDEYLLMVIDCTGHGVPGAFVTMIVKSIERQITSRIINSDEEVSPAKLLSVFNKSMKHLLKQNDADSKSNVGFDGAILYCDKSKGILKYAGAQIPLWVMKESKIEMIQPNRYSVGYNKCDPNYIYTDHTIPLAEESTFYLSTDGYFDQSGGDKGFGFGKKRFQLILEEIGMLNLRKQKDILHETLISYQGDEPRLDDITLIGFKV